MLSKRMVREHFLYVCGAPLHPRLQQFNIPRPTMLLGPIAFTAGVALKEAYSGAKDLARRTY